MTFPFHNVPGARSSLLTGLSAYWKFDEGSGTTAYDSSGNGANLTLSGSSWGTGIINSCFNPNGSVYASVTNSAIRQNYSFTYSTWVKLSSIPGTSVVIAEIGTTGGDENLWLYYNPYPYIQYGMTSSGAITDYPTISAGVWYHIVVVLDTVAQTFSLYINGSLAKSSSIGTERYTGSSSLIRVGAYYTDGFIFTGLIDETGLWSRALTLAEIGVLYNSGAGKSYPFS
ncbi:MAG: LamG domain-containing protein [Rhodomicrobium sp.]